jgi:hypothetical protein
MSDCTTAYHYRGLPELLLLILAFQGHSLIVKHRSSNRGHIFFYAYIRGAGKSLARPTSRFTLFDGENISFDDIIDSTNIPPTMFINRIYETQNLLSL